MLGHGREKPVRPWSQEAGQGDGEAQFLPLLSRAQDGNAASLLTHAVRSLTVQHRQPSPCGVALGQQATDLCAVGAAAQRIRAPC